ncbi:MAG TPA: insulinase family protein, partial [Bacteroidia bacterium]|nr:insulinase family protein [Bacteroidia bacterium]
MKTPTKPGKLLLLLLLLLASVPFARAQSTARLPFDPDVRVGTLPNGMTYYIRKNAEPANRAEFRLAVNAGSVNEDDAQQGLAHFCEHMAFNGTTHFKKSELVDALEGMGVKFGPHLNAYTSFDETVYMLQVPTDKQELIDKALLVLEDWAHGLSFDDNEIDKERGVVLEEWRLRSGAMTRMIQEIMPVVTNGSKYAERLPIGKPEILKNFKYQVLKDFYNKWYRPDLMAVVVVGDFDLDKMTEQVKKQFGAIPSNSAGDRQVFEVPDHEDVKAKVVNDPESQFTLLQIMFKHDNFQYQTEADFRADLVAQLGCAMLTGRLDELKQTGQLSTLFNLVFDGSIQGIRAKSALNVLGVLNAEGAKKGIDIILTELERARRHGFIPTEFERQKSKMLKDAENAFNERQKTPSEQLAAQYVDCFLEQEPTVGPAKNLELLKAMLPGISLDEVNTMLKALLQPRNTVIALAGAEKENAKFPTETEILDKMKSLATENIEAYKEIVDDRPLISKQPVAGKIASETKDAQLGITEWKLSNGAKVILKPTPFKDDELILEAFSLGGSSRFGDAEFDKGWACAQLIGESGVGPFKQSVLQKKLADKSVQIMPYITDYEEGISAMSSVKDAETMFQLLYLYFTAPRQDKEAFGAFQETMKGMVGFSNGPEGQFRDSVMVTLAQHHRRRFPLTEAKVMALDLQRSYMNYMDRFMEASDFTFVLVGNFEPEKIKPWVEQY